MKNLRKLLAVLLLVSIAISTGYASTNISESSEQTTTTSVVLDLGEQPTSYTVVIPSQVTIDPTTGESNATVTLKSGFVLTDITSLAVRMTGGYTEYDNYFVSSGAGGYNQVTNSHMILRNTANNSTISCGISTNPSSEGGITYETNLISVNNQTDNSVDYSKTLYFKVKGTLPSYGKYTGSLTFSVITG